MGAAAALCSCFAAHRAAAQNVVVIVMDDVGAGLIGAYDAYFQANGRPPSFPANTPAIDQLLAARGVVFTRAWSTPICSPSRASLLTGCQPSRTGVGALIDAHGAVDNVGLDPRVGLIPEILHAAPFAYECAAAGKWHLSDPAQLRADPTSPLGQPAGRWFDRYAGVLFNLKRDVSVPEHETGYFQWDKYFASPIDANVNPCEPWPTPCNVVRSASAGGYATVDTADDALVLLQQLQEPFFLYVSFSAVHMPAHAVPSGLPGSSCGGYAPPAVACDPGSPATKATLVRCMLESLDGQIARVLCAVDEGDTTVILTADNGSSRQVVLPPYLPSHFKGSVYEGGLNVPLIVRSPRIAPEREGTCCDALVGLVDVFATTCELAGVDPQTTPGVDSISLVPYLDGGSAPLRTLQYTEAFAPNFTPDPLLGGPPAGYVGVRHDQALRDARFKLIRKWRRSHTTWLPILTEEFYDSVAGGPPAPGTQAPTPDFLEAHDLLAAGAPALSPEAAAALANLRAELDAQHPSLVY